VQYQPRDKTVPLAVEKALPQIEILVSQVVDKMKNGADYFISVLNSGRLGVVDASECPLLLEYHLIGCWY
jgi:N-acetylmuramic acid 6-phosphate etherase